MAQTIRRNAAPARRQARSQGNRTKVRKARAKTNSLIDALMRVLPFTEEQLHKTFLVLILGKRQHAHQGVDQRVGLRPGFADFGPVTLRAGLAPRGRGVATDRLRHQLARSSLPKCASASSMMISTSSG